MNQVDKLLKQSIRIGEYNCAHIDKQLCEDYSKSSLYQILTHQERKLYDILFGNDKDLTKIILTAEKVLDFLKGILKYNGYYDTELDEEELDLFLNTFISGGNSIYRKLNLFYGITYSDPRSHNFSSYNKDKLELNPSDLYRFKQVSLLDLGDGLYMVFPLMAGAYNSNDYLVTNIMTKLLNAEYIMDSDLFFEFYKVYDDYRLSYLADKTLDGNLANLSEMYKIISLTQDEIFKYRLEKSLNPEFKLHLKIFEVAKEFSMANKDEASFISEATRNYNPTIKKIYDLYSQINGYYMPFMTDVDYLILDWIRYKIAVTKGDLALAEELGIKILKNQEKLSKLPKTFYLYTNHALPLHGSKGELLRYFCNHYIDQILCDLLNYYVKNYRYEDAYAILREHDDYFRKFFQNVDDLSNTKLISNKLRKAVQLDIALIITDHYAFNEDIKDKWLNRIQEATTRFNRSKADLGDYKSYKTMSQYFSNIIIVMISIEHYEIAKILLTLYNEFLIKDEDYVALERFVARESMLKSNVETLEEMLGLFSLKNQESQKLLDSFFELTDSEMTKELSLSESDHNVISIISTGNKVDYDHCLKLIKNAQEKYIKRMSNNDIEYDYFSNYFNEGLNKLARLVQDNPTYNEVENELRSSYDSLWEIFAVDTKNYLVTGNVLYHSLITRKDFEQFDYSPVCLCWAKSIESELQKKFYLPLIMAYNASLNSTDGVKYKQSTFLKPSNCINWGNNGEKRVDTKKFTLGSLTYISGLYSSGDYRNESDWYRFREFLKENIYTSYNDYELKYHITSLIKMSEKLNFDYRIKAAHPLDLINKTEVSECKNIVFQSQELLRKIANNMDKDWILKSLNFK